MEKREGSGSVSNEVTNLLLFCDNNCGRIWLLCGNTAPERLGGWCKVVLSRIWESQWFKVT